jgi:glycosyltransferase involved in cell wall biosynthesis
LTNSSPVQVSAIVAAYNSERFIEGCLPDLEAQTIADRLEIIVVDSASEQNEDAVVRQWQELFANVRYIRTLERVSFYAALNRGIRLAGGVYLTTPNTDDRYRANRSSAWARAWTCRRPIAVAPHARPLASPAAA